MGVTLPEPANPDDVPHADPEPTRQAPLPPRWFIRTAWAVHRFLYRVTAGRFGLRPNTPKRWGMLRLETIGRRSGKRRVAILGYYEDGPNLVTMAMNGWGEPEPAWWLNLQARPDTTVVLHDGPRPVHARAATPDERPRLWAKVGRVRRRGEPRQLVRSSAARNRGRHPGAPDLTDADGRGHERAPSAMAGMSSAR
jgi:deazaflavin-dependent oxidoreductase (nitroreductase family)